MAQTPAVKTTLRRSFSEHVKDSTNKAWDVFWRSVRERRLWGEFGFDVNIDRLRKGEFTQGCRSILVAAKALFSATLHDSRNRY